MMMLIIILPTGTVLCSFPSVFTSYHFIVHELQILAATFGFKIENYSFQRRT